MNKILMEEEGFTFAILLNNINDYIFVHEYLGFKQSGPFLIVNKKACHELGYTQEEMSNLTPLDISLDDEYSSTSEQSTLLTEHNALLHEKTLVKKSGGLIPVEINSVLFEGKSGKKYALSIARDLRKRRKFEKDREKVIRKLKETLEEVKILREILPICSYCKKIRDDEGYWRQLENYIESYTNSKFTHGICDECIEKKFGKEHLWEYKNSIGKSETTE